jgi:hypothetical protein
MNLVKLHAFVVEKMDDDSLVILHRWLKFLSVHQFQKTFCPFSFDQKDGIRYDLQNIEGGSEYLPLAMRQTPTPFASGWRHYL